MKSTKSQAWEMSSNIEAFCVAAWNRLHLNCKWNEHNFTEFLKFVSKKLEKICKIGVFKFANLGKHIMVRHVPKFPYRDMDNHGEKRRPTFCAHIAQLVERILGKDEVFGPIPNAGSTLLSGEAWIVGRLAIPCLSV